MALTCFQYFGFKTLDEVDRMTVKEYVLLCEATKKREKDKMRNLMLLAWQTFRATAKKKAGKNLKPLYPTFDSFYKEQSLADEKKTDSLKARYKQLQERLNK